MADSFVFNEWRMSKVDAPIPPELVARMADLDTRIGEIDAVMAELKAERGLLFDAKFVLNHEISIARHPAQLAVASYLGVEEV